MSAESQADVIRLRIPSDPKYLSSIRRAIRSIANSAGFAESMADDIEVSVSEAVANAIEHGSPHRKQNAVVVECRVDSDKLTIRVCDEGRGFDTECSDDECDLLDERGRGLKLIYGLMDKVEVKRNKRGSCVRMVKRNPQLPARRSRVAAG